LRSAGVRSARSTKQARRRHGPTATKRCAARLAPPRRKFGSPRFGAPIHVFRYRSLPCDVQHSKFVTSILIRGDVCHCSSQKGVCDEGHFSRRVRAISSRRDNRPRQRPGIQGPLLSALSPLDCFLTHDRRQRLRSDRGLPRPSVCQGPLSSVASYIVTGAAEHLTIATTMYHELGMTAARLSA
jgi:hypothetical protein